ncbi:MAG: MarR family transcriptional regulator [Solirubrobacterales bacterium]|nr:MarR family transcriptional regulator [Solirubrobacterales bacterium]
MPAPPRPQTDAAEALAAVAPLATRWIERLLAQGETPLTMTQYLALRAIAREQISSAELARRAGVTRQTMHRAVTQLVDEGLLVSTPGPGFPRSSLIELTAAGRERRDIASGILRDLEHALAGRLGTGTLAELRESLTQAWPG